jgi:hypothetical protein
MNEEALRVLYGLAQGDGYKKSFNEFKTLMSQNSDAVSTMYSLAQGDGYKKSRDEFNTLVGFGVTATETVTETEEPKKKDESVSTATEEVSVSESQQPQETTTSATSQPVQVQLPQFDVYERDRTTVSQPGLTFEQPQFGGQRVLEPIKPYDPFQVIPLERDRTTVSQQGLVVDTDPISKITQAIGQIEGVEEQQTFPPSPISRPTVTTSMDVPTLTEQDIADLEQARKEQAEAEARTKLIELGQPDAEEIIQPDAAPADATRVVGPDLVIPEEREITIQELAARQTPSDPSPFEPAAVDATFSQTAADIAKIDASEEGIQKRIEEEEREFAADQLKRQLGIFSFEDNTLIEDIFGKNTVTNFIGDIYRAAGQGQAQGAVVDDAIALMRKGPNATDADIMQFIEAYNRMLESGVSDEMQDFNKIYEESGGGLVGFWNGFKSNPSVFPQLFVSSASAMFNPASLVAGVAAAGPGFLAAGPGGALVFGIGGVSSALEAALTYAELLQEEIGVNTPMTIENVRAVLSQPGIQDRLTWKSTGRGLTIGAVEAFTAALGVKATSLVTGRTGSQLVGGLTGTAVEGAGGATGEFLGRKVAGQEDDFLEVAFEGTVGGITTAPFTVTRGLIDARNQGQYKINDGVATRDQVISLLETGTDADIAGTKLDIENDPELRTAAEDAKARIRNNAEIKAELAQAGVIDNNKVDAIIPLEVEKQGLSGNTTEAGKRRLKEINDQINSILDEPTAVTTETEAVRIYEGKDRNGNTKQVKLTTQENGRIRLDIVNDDGSTALIGDFPAESTDTDIVSNIIDIEQDFNIVKPEDAIQESSTETVDVQEPTRDSEAVGERDATGPVTTEVEAEVQVEETPVTVREEAADLAAMVGEELQAPAPTTEAAPVVTEETAVAEEAEVETYTLPETIKERKQDFEIIDNRGEKAGLEIDEDGSGRWYVENKKTGSIADFRTKSEAQEGIRNPDWDYGEGAPIITEETTVAEAAPAVTEEDRPLTEEQREVMYESDRKSALNGLGYKNDYIGDILEKIYGQLSDRSFSSTWRKHVDPFFSSEYVGLSGGMTFRQYTSEEMIGQRFFVSDVTAEENGMQKFIDFVNDANKKIAKKGGQTVDLVPLERTAPAVTEETTVAETTTEAAPAVTEETTVTETTTEAAPVAELTEEQREFITEDDAGINGLAYTPNYIETVWDNIIDVLGNKSFTSLFKKHINEDFTSSMIEEELGEFSSTMIDLDDGMQKFIDLVNDANKRIKRKGGNQIKLMPLERTAPSSEALIEVGMTDENTEADFKRFEQEYKDRNPFQVDPFNDDLTDKRKQARDDKAKQYAQEQVKKMLQESKAPAKPKPTTKPTPKKKVDGFVDEILFTEEELKLVDEAKKAVPAVTKDTNVDEVIPEGDPFAPKIYSKQIGNYYYTPKKFTIEEANILKDKILDQYRKIDEPDKGDPFFDETFKYVDRIDHVGRLTDFTEGAVTNYKSNNFVTLPKIIRSGKRKFTREEADRRIKLTEADLAYENFVTTFPKDIIEKNPNITKMRDSYKGPRMTENFAERIKETILRYTEADETAVPKAPAKPKPTPAPKAKPAPAPKVEPVAKGVDPFYDSVEAQQKQEERIGKLADKARTAIKKVLPDAKIILHRTEAEYNKATKANSKGSQGGAGSRGVLIGDTIHVNMPHANDRTIAHEVFHALLTNLSKENSVDVINLTKKMAASLRGKIKDKLVLAELDEFVDQYSGQVESAQAEENGCGVHGYTC